MQGERPQSFKERLRRFGFWAINTPPKPAMWGYDFDLLCTDVAVHCFELACKPNKCQDVMNKNDATIIIGYQ
eukprot:2926125-Rhodomonas_salina.1